MRKRLLAAGRRIFSSGRLFVFAPALLCGLAYALSFGELLAQQPERLPPVAEQEDSLILPRSWNAPPEQVPGAAEWPVVSDGSMPYGDEPADESILFPPQPSAPPARPAGKDGMLQRTTFTGTWLPGGGAGGTGVSDLSLEAMLAVPWFIYDSPLLISPRFAVHYFDGPSAIDVPAEIYDTAVEFRWMKQVTPRFAADLSVAPGVYSDFDNSSSKSFRVTGRGLALIEWSPTSQLALGVMYLGRSDIVALPIAGWIWKPDDDTRLEIMVPRPRFARRFLCDSDRELWWYVTGELGGNTWAIRRASGVDDQITYRDFRFILGLESKATDGSVARFEAGYVFGREFEYGSGTTGFSADPTLMLRAQLAF